jgi:hypothetical protein
LIHSAGFSFDESRFAAKQNQVKLLVEQADFCAEQCLDLTSKAEKVQFVPAEIKCVNICAQKMFQSEKILRTHMPYRLQSSKQDLSETEVAKRLNNPTDSYGPYFTKEWDL